MLLRRLRQNHVVVSIVASVLVAIPLGILLVPNRLFPDFHIPNDRLSRGGDNGGTQSTAAMLNEATAAMLRGDYDQAIRLYDAILHDDPDNDVALLGRGFAHSETRDHDRAIVDLSRAIELQPGRTNYRVHRGYAYEAKGDFDSAIEDFTKAIQLDPRNAEAFARRGHCQQSKTEIEKAIQDFNEAIRLEPSKPQWFTYRADVYKAKNDTARAAKDYDEAIRLAPNNSRWYYVRGLFHADNKEYAKATADFEKALQLNPKDAFPLEEFAWLLATCPDARFRKGKLAVEYAKTACELRGNDAHSLDTLAAAYAEIGNFREAVTWQNKALESPAYDKEYEGRPTKRLKLYEQGKPYRLE
jgi:tetratricopeptide (TPR) repeat protein